MAIDLGLYRNIRRLYNDGHSQRRIARILHCSRKTVMKYCQGALAHDTKKTSVGAVASLRQTLEQKIEAMIQENKSLPRKQQMTAKDMWRELRRKGFAVGESTVRRHVRELSQKHAESFVPLDFDPGEAMQVDWGDNKAWIGGVYTNVSTFVTVLPYSHAPYAVVFPDKTNPCFLEGHVRAFEWYRGVPRRCIYDNGPNAVASGSGTTAEKTEDFKKLEAHYCFDGDLCNAYAGWEKGSVENTVSIVRHIAFTPIPRVKDWTELQQHVEACCLDYLETHKIRYRPESIKTMLTREREHLNPLPLTPLETAKKVTALVDSDLTIMLDRTKYSVPPDYVGRKVTLKVSPFTVAVWYKGQEIATHPKALQKGDHRYVPDHYLDLLLRKPRAVANAAPLKKGVMPRELKDFLKLCRAQDKEHQLLEILLLARTFDSDQLLWAVDQANRNGSPTYQLVCFYLKIAAPVVEDECQSNITVEHTALTEYDELLGDADDDE